MSCSFVSIDNRSIQWALICVRVRPGCRSSPSPGPDRWLRSWRVTLCGDDDGDDDGGGDGVDGGCYCCGGSVDGAGGGGCCGCGSGDGVGDDGCCCCGSGGGVDPGSRGYMFANSSLPADSGSVNGSLRWAHVTSRYARPRRTGA